MVDGESFDARRKEPPFTVMATSIDSIQQSGPLILITTLIRFPSLFTSQDGHSTSALEEARVSGCSPPKDTDS